MKSDRTVVQINQVCTEDLALWYHDDIGSDCLKHFPIVI